MELELQGKKALVTASSEGLGLACAARLAACGAHVAICGRDTTKLKAAQESIGAATFAFSTDLAQPDAIEPLFHSAVEALDGLDVLVVNSGHMPYGVAEELDDTAWYFAFDLILMSAIRLAKLAVPYMRSHCGGSIIFITASGAKEPSPHLVLSNVMRAGLTSLAKTLAITAAPEVRINVVAPGYFDTGRVKQQINDLSAEEGVDRADAAKQVAGTIPLGRAGNAEELADLVAFLSSSRSTYITGSNILIDGGKTRSIF